ncbi:MAG: hypothetical protein MMC33_006280 [Icmadophila ericetorum]|nr:hypothetical protein [Icmadophila ericetorum]
MHDSSAIGAMASSSISGDAFAFLVHSQESLMNGASGTEYQPSARTRRRRTSPEDQAILEAEYRRNSKPDKKARMEIVSRVALGEKEVQVYKPGFLHSSLGEGYAYGSRIAAKLRGADLGLPNRAKFSPLCTQAKKA